MVHATCAALHCLSSSHIDKDLKFHQFPHDAERRKIWITACKRSDVIDKDWNFFKHKYVCSKHFQKCMYSKKGHLKKSAVPSRHLSEKPLQHDSSTQTIESIQYANQQSEKDVSILYVMPKVEISSATAHTQTEDSLPYDNKHVNIKDEIITHTKIKESESVEQDVEIKTEYDDDADLNSDSEAFEEYVEMKTEIVENEILPLLKSTQPLQSVDLEITKDGGTLSTQAKNLLQDIGHGLTAPIVNRTSTYPINTTTTPILKTEVDESIQTDRVIVLSENADGSAGSINPEECRCKRNNYLGMNRLQFYKACSKFLSANFAITVRRRMHLDDVAKAESSGRKRWSKTLSSESIEYEEVVVLDDNDDIASTETAADSAETDMDAVDCVEASAAVSATDCAQSERRRPRTRGPRRGRGVRVRGKRGGIVMEEVVVTAPDRGGPSRRGRRRRGRANLRNERPGLRTIDKLVTRDMSEMPEDQGLETAPRPKRMRMCKRTNLAPAPPPSPPPLSPSSASFPVSSLAIVEPERPVACDLDKKDWDVTGNDHYDHVRHTVGDVSPPVSLQSVPRPVSEPSGVTVKKKRKRNRIRRFAEKIAEGSEFDSDLDENFDPDEITSSGASMARNIPDDDDLDENISKIINSTERVMDDAIDQLVSVPNDFNWCANFDTFQGVPEEFSGPTPGPIEDYDTPYDAFTAIWSNDIIEHIVNETNKYAKQVIDEKTIAGTLKPSSYLRFWSKTDKDEVYMLLALHILMGLDQRTTQQEFWKCTGYLEMPKFRKLMRYKRFLLLNRVFHFEGASQDLPQSEGIALTAKWRKIAPIVGHLNNKFSNLYNLHADITIDESLTKGRCSWGQAIRSKTAWNGIKSYEVYDSCTGYLYKFEIYTEKNSKQDNFSSRSEALAEKSPQVVMDLLTGLETRGHCITMDNFYNSPAFARHLKSLGFDCLGTLRPNRKNVPLEIKNVPKNMAKGTIIARHCGDVSCIAWQDTKMVTMISTYHTSETCIDRELVKPIVIRDYNKTMTGVNLKDKKLSMYLFEKRRFKRSQKWYLKIFLRLLNVSVRNAFILLSGSLNRRGMPLCTDRDFREELANSLLANSPQLPEVISAPIKGKYTRLRKDILHVPKYHTDVADRWRCFICSRKGINKMVYSSCVTCNEFICFEGCWSEWHSLQELPSSINVSCQKRKCSA